MSRESANASGPTRTIRTTRSHETDLALVDKRMMVNGHRVIGTHSDVVIRRISRGDEKALLDFFDEASQSARRDRFHHHVSEFPKRHLDDLLDATGVIGLLAECKNAVIGFASGTTSGAGAGELAVWVKDEWQRRGIGTRLMTASINALVARGLPHVFARVESANVAAIALVRSVFPSDADRRMTPTGEVVSVALARARRRRAA